MAYLAAFAAGIGLLLCVAGLVTICVWALEDRKG